MTKQSLFSDQFCIKTSAAAISHYLNGHKEGWLYLDAPYQRDYVWTAEDRQLLLESIFDGFPIEGIALTYNEHSQEDRYMEIINGKQRITTIVMFAHDEFKYYDRHTGESYLFSEMTKADQSNFKKVHLPLHELQSLDKLKDVPELQKLKYFYRNNFTGVDQTEDHKQRVAQMIKDEEQRLSTIKE